TYNFDFNASGLSSGLYIYKLTAGNFTQSKKMLLLK
ncbi:MAG TPA: T9SS type A sorting domain-containing protein, partial [Ignavibacteriaceae bacterium]